MSATGVLGDGEPRRRFAAAGTAAAALLVFTSWVGLGVGGEHVALYVDDLGTLLAAIAAAALCVGAGRRQAGRLRAFWWLLGAASAAWALGEAIWAVYDLILVRPVPVPSWADIGYLGAVPLAAAALLCHPSMQGSGARTTRSAFDGLVVATALLFLSWVFVLGPIERDSDQNSIGGAVALAYPFGDVVIVWFVVIVIRRMTAGDRLPLWCLLAGLLCLAFADSTYAYLTEVKTYTAGQLLDAGWMAGYLGIALGAYVSRAPPAGCEQVAHREATLTPIVAGFLPMLVALGVVNAQVQLGRHLDVAGVVIAFALVLLVLARHAFVAADMATAPAHHGRGLFGRLHTALVGSASSEQRGSSSRERSS